MIDVRPLLERAEQPPSREPKVAPADRDRLNKGIAGLRQVMTMLKAAQKTGNYSGITKALRVASRPIKDLGQFRHSG